MIRAGNISDIDSILNITKSCAAHMIQNGIYQWNEHYPDKSSFINDAENMELYVYIENEKVIACISLCKKMDKVYFPVSWITKNYNNLYIHTTEGKDDMPAHIKSALTNNQISISIKDSELLLGTWQGLFLFEHRLENQSRTIIHHYIGD